MITKQIWSVTQIKIQCSNQWKSVLRTFSHEYIGTQTVFGQQEERSFLAEIEPFGYTTAKSAVYVMGTKQLSDIIKSFNVLKPLFFSCRKGLASVNISKIDRN